MNTLFPSHKNGGAGRILDYSIYTHKACSKCKRVLPVSEFKKEKRQESGKGWRYVSQCKECKRPYHNAYRAQQRRAEGIPERQRKSREDFLAAQRRASRRHYARHLQEQRQRTAQWRRSNPEKQRFMEKRRRTRKRGASGSHTFDQWLQVKREFGAMCVLCQRSDVKLTQDHAVPLSRGGTDFIENILPLCMSCNASKQDKVLDPLDVEWLRFRDERDLFALIGLPWVEPEDRA